jgi:hypothetical protein
MNITFGKSKECVCYRDLVSDETDRFAKKRFTKQFSQELITAALKLHKRLKASPNAEVYNNTSSDDNKIQLKEGTKNKDPLELKIRIQKAYRIFFYYVIREKEGEYCLREEWKGQFREIEDIHIFTINKHEYKP